MYLTPWTSCILPCRCPYIFLQKPKWRMRHSLEWSIRHFVFKEREIDCVAPRKCFTCMYESYTYMYNVARFRVLKILSPWRLPHFLAQRQWLVLSRMVWVFVCRTRGSVFDSKWRFLTSSKFALSSMRYTWNIQVNMIYRLNVGLMLGQRHRQWSNTEPTFGRCIGLSGTCALHRSQWPVRTL